MQGAYHLMPLSALAILLYLFSLLLVKTGLLIQSLQRKIWNVILLLTFLVSGILGILLVIQVNWKFEWAWMKPLMVWHVDTGIIMTIVAFFHIVRHWKYFMPRAEARGNEAKARGDKASLPGILLAGLFSTIVQVLFIREITTVFQGNELMMGATLGLWMLLTGGGSYLGRRFSPAHPASFAIRLLLLLSLIPPFIALLLTFTRTLTFPPGELIDIFWFLLIVLLLTAPVCVLSGLTFAIFVRAAGEGEKRFASVYLLEAVGSVVGGLLVSFIFVHWFNILQSLMLTGVIIQGVLWFVHKKRTIALLFLAGLVGTAATFLFPADRWLKSILFANQHIVETKETPYGNITISENGGEYSIYENGSLLFSTGDIILNEEFVHYAMLQHPQPAHVLLVSGGISGMVEEIIHYPEVQIIDAVEINPALIPVVSPYKPMQNDPRISVIEGDGRRFIQQTDRTYDVVIFAVPDPSNLQVNRYYTAGFLDLLKKRLNEGAVVIFGISPSGNYLSPSKTKMEAAILHTLESRFRQVVIIPGERDYFVASDRPLSARMGELSAARALPLDYVTPGYMDDASMEERAALIRERLGEVSVLNSDRQPLPVFYATLRYISQFSGKNAAWMLLPVLLLILPLLATRRASAGMYITGFTASSLEILLIFWFQTSFGNVYAAIGLIFALFMGGLALGSAFGKRSPVTRNRLLSAQALLVLYMMLLPLLWETNTRAMPESLLWLLFVPVLLFPALLTGYLYVLITANHPDHPGSAAASVYAADLWGSSLGAILVTLVLLPLLGITVSCFAIAALNLVAILFYRIRKP